MIIVLILLFLGLLALAVPVAHVLVIASGGALLWGGQVPLMLLAQQMVGETQSFPMLALPFFILAGSLMMSGRLGEALIGFATELVQRFRGGLGSVSVVGSCVFGGVSGSAVADATALGGMLIPWQKRQGYPGGFTAANNAASASIAILIPPSIPFILYSLVSGVSVAHLFVAGVLPGLILTTGFVTVCNLSARLRGFPHNDQAFDWPKCRRLFVSALPALVMPILILVLLRFGFATPTEVSAIAVFYALAVGVFVYSDMTVGRFINALIAAGVATGVVMLVIMGSSAVGWLMTFAQVPQRFAAWSLETLQEPWLIILAMNFIMLVAGMFIDLPAAILLLGPIFVPLANAIGLDLTQLGLIMVLNLAVGLYTPPVGTTLFISASIARVSIIAASRELWPFYLVAISSVIAFSYLPFLTL
ncbi:Neu5Ac permease (plasmid) [Hartmannibacter diazotrophicus]|uniref:TRAP transporter large permease protein n=1 Tax=Hartmannibacter diazotrophicus TaxID=1482074 RepID=A0A2C9DDT1_9HYPH|nr:TRAP transporter large permease [Hartmannibacter diazotrophicus]SON58457.1 Neu5Ac permease [Hartmannibacter diazotrophicus]